MLFQTNLGEGNDGIKVSVRFLPVAGPETMEVWALTDVILGTLLSLQYFSFRLSVSAQV